MLIAAAVLFAIAALGGLTMAYIHFKQDRNPPGALAALHGVAAATALVILLWAVVQTSAGGAVAWSLGLFVVAALGGFFLVSHHIRKRRLPSPVVVVHALAAVAAFVLLLAALVPV
jgi:glucose uptake protein GlcU